MADRVLVAGPLGAPSHLLADLTHGSCPAIAYEHPGHFLCPPLARGAVMSDYARVMLGIAACAGADRVALVGFGFGGMIALQAALDEPDKISRLILACTTAGPGDADAWRRRAADVRARGLSALAPEIVARWVTPKLASAQPDLLANLQAALMTCSDDGYAAACEAIAGYDLTARLGELEVPTLVLAGAEDAGMPADHGRRLAAAAPGARYVEVAGAGHLPFLERHDYVRALLAEHLIAERIPA